MNTEYEYEYEYLPTDDNQLGDSGNGSAYTAIEQKLTMPLTQPLKPQMVTEDVNVMTMRAQAAMPVMLELINPIMNTRLIEFKWARRKTSNSDSQNNRRNYISLGKLDTLTRKFELWGVDTWTEFTNHLHAADRSLAREYWEEIHYAISQASDRTGSHTVSFWVAKDSTNTAPGFWTIAVTSAAKRELCIFANGRMIFKELKLSQTNGLII